MIGTRASEKGIKILNGSKELSIMLHEGAHSETALSFGQEYATTCEVAVSDCRADRLVPIPGASDYTVVGWVSTRFIFQVLVPAFLEDHEYAIDLLAKWDGAV